MTTHSDRSRQVVLVSDRGPVRFTDSSGKLLPVRRTGSVTALLEHIAGRLAAGVMWIAPSAAEDDAEAVRRGLLDDLPMRLGFRHDLVPVRPQDYIRYYYDAGVQIIWTVWHGIEDEIPVVLNAEDSRRSLGGYIRVNRILASRIAATANEGALVSIHDYQLMLVPEMLRERRSDVAIVHFTHTPFPNWESLAALPIALVTRLVDGMLGADLLGFQSVSWARRFLDCCDRLGLRVDHTAGWVAGQGRRVWIRCYPVTVDGLSLTARAQSREVAQWAVRAKAGDHRKVIARVDRLDPSKNIVRGFEAYGMLLQRRPDLANETRFVACLVPSREQQADYRRYADRTWRLIDDINRRHPGSITAYRGNDQDRALGILRTYDVLLVNSIADGMNLVAQEGALVNENDGVIILSSTTGSADLLPGVVTLDNPASVEATVKTLECALSLTPEQRQQRARKGRLAIEGVKSADWLEAQLVDLWNVRAGGAPSSVLPSS
jgi:trehalose 6-phosphate synthase